MYEYQKMITDDNIEELVKEYFQLQKTGVIGDSKLRDIIEKSSEETGTPFPTQMISICIEILEKFAKIHMTK